jgi:hypothetical protein
MYRPQVQHVQYKFLYNLCTTTYLYSVQFYSFMQTHTLHYIVAQTRYCLLVSI